MRRFVFLFVAAGCAGAVSPATSLPDLGGGSDLAQRINTPSDGAIMPTFDLAQSQDSGPITPVGDHPRLFITSSDVTTLRGWASAANPLWVSLSALGDRSKSEMDAGGDPFNSPECGSYGLEPCEGYAELFAFLSLIDPDASRRMDYQTRAHALLMKVIGIYNSGVLDWHFETSDRSRWYGEGMALTTDWIYSSLSSAEKQQIRTAFLKLCDANVHATTTSDNHPEPIGVVNDPQLLADRSAVRFAGNNYYLAHMRNIGLMSMAIDPADDANGDLGKYLANATGAWLYVFDHLTRTDWQGGLGAEGFEYTPQSVSYAAQFLLALRTAGQNDVTRFGSQVRRENNPFWDDLIHAHLQALSPVTSGDAYQPAWYGDGQHYEAGDYVALFGALARDSIAAGDNARAQLAAWVAVNTAPGGAASLADRVRNVDNLRDAILYFIIIDPAAAPIADPRALMPTAHFAPGLGTLLARTDWTANARWFQMRIGWQSVDHQHADGNDFGFYRKGEWLTKEQMGYDSSTTDIEASDAHNTVSVLNNGPTDHTDWRLELQQRGSQFPFVNDGDGQMAAHSVGSDYVTATGIATPLYNSMYESSSVQIEDVSHVSRSIVWLQPDVLVIYDRAETKTAGRFKRVWLHYANQPTVSGNVITARTPNGQQLFVTSLLGGIIAADQPNEPDLADGEPMHWRTKTESTDQKARFLHILEGADSGAARTVPTLVQSTTHDGALVGGTVVMFPKDLGATSAAWSDPPNATRHLVTGLQPNTKYDVAVSGSAISVQPGTHNTTDDAGVLAF
jgi:hypothetical protein